MSRLKEFPFDRARLMTPHETERYRRGIEKKLGVKRLCRGRPPKNPAEKYRAVAIRLHPKALQWAKKEAKKRSVGYQTIINELLLKFAA